MERQEFMRGARVLGNDGAEIGTLETIDETSEPPSLVVRLRSDDRPVRIPYHQVDEQQSSDREIITTIPGTDLLHSFAPTHEEHVADERVGTAVASPAPESADHLRIPLAEEEMVVGTRDVERGRVVVRKRVETVPHEESIAVDHDEVDVERVAVNRDVDEAPAIRHEGDTMIVPVVEEVLVVEKRLRVVEEVHITRRRVSEERTVRDELRREVVDVSADPVAEPDLD
jgi:uncharacterized protein (TIGR02271 family)